MEYHRMMLKMNLERLKERTQTNHLLSDIVKDYEEYEEKLKQQDAIHQSQIQYIKEYIDDLIETNDLTESGLNHAKYEQDRILKKLYEVKKTI